MDLGWAPPTDNVCSFKRKGLEHFLWKASPSSYIFSRIFFPPQVKLSVLHFPGPRSNRPKAFSCFEIWFSQNLGFPIKWNQIVLQRNAKLNPVEKDPSTNFRNKIIKKSSLSPQSLPWFPMIKSGPTGSFRGYLNIPAGSPTEKLNFCAVRKFPGRPQNIKCSRAISWSVLLTQPLRKDDQLV